MTKIKKYLSLVKFSHTIFAMPFALIGLVLGIQYFILNQMNENEIITKLIIEKSLLVIVCMIAARSAAMAFNRFLDYKFDAKNPRTAIREIPTGTIKPKNALIFTLCCSAVFVATCLLINDLCFYLSFVALFVILFYSYTKRFTALCHLVLGVGLSLAPIGAFLAVTGVFQLLPILFSCIVICWVSGFDIIYALQDEEFDKSNRLHSIPVYLGKKKALILSSFLHFISALLVIYIGMKYPSTWLYWVGALLFCGMLIYQHSVVKPNDLSKVNLAFMTSNGIASVVFALFVIADKIIQLNLQQ